MMVKRVMPYLLAAFGTAMCVLECGFTILCLRNVIFLSTLIYLSVIDWYHYMIPDKALLIAILVWFGCIPFAFTAYGGVSGVLGAILCAIAFGGGMLVFTLIMDRLLQKETMGGGDIKLFAVLGLYLGMPDALLAMMLSCVFGLCFALLCIGRGRSQIPFGPSIALAGWIMLLYGDFVVDWYIKMIL